MRMSDMDRKTDLIIFLQGLPLSAEVISYCSRQVHEVCFHRLHHRKSDAIRLIQDVKDQLSYNSMISERFITEFVTALMGVTND